MKMLKTLVALSACLAVFMGSTRFSTPLAQAQNHQDARSLQAGRDAKSGDTEHEPFIRKCYALAIRSGENGDHPFGAVLVHQGAVILTARNTVYTDDDPTHHAEINLMVHARRKFTRDVIKNSTVYTSMAPCPMCSYALAARGITRVVYGVSYAAFGALLGSNGKHLPGDVVYRYLDKELEFIGPVLEEEGMAVFNSWPEQDELRHVITKNTPQGK